jgi:hypothetical protein
MNLPSIKTLSRVFGDQAKAARKILEMTRAELSETPAGAARLSECYNPPTTTDLRMHVLQALDNGLHGLEGIQNNEGYWLEYLNAGDTYAPTIMHWNGRYIVADLGTIIENPRNKF